MGTIDESQLNLADLGAKIEGLETTVKRETRNEKWGTRNERREGSMYKETHEVCILDPRREGPIVFCRMKFWTPEGKGINV